MAGGTDTERRGIHHNGTVESGLAVDEIVLAVGALLTLGVLGAGIASRFQLPGIVVSLGLGMALGSDGLGWVDIGVNDLDWVQSLSVMALVLILFDGGLSTSTRAVRDLAAPAALLATAGVGVTMAVVACGARLLLAVEWETALLLGAVVSSTDAAAVFSVLRRAPVPARLRNLLEVESGFNDPAAAMLTIGVLETWRASPTAGNWVLFGITHLAVGALAGVLVGLVAIAVLNRVRLDSAPRLALLALAFGGLSYGLATLFHGSGLLACYLAGLMIGNGVLRHRRIIQSFHAALGSGAELALFLVLGLFVFPSQIGSQFFEALAVAAVLVFVARPIAVALCLTWFGFSWRQQTLAAWAGLRGAVPIVLATFPLAAGHPDGQVIFDQVFFVVLISAALQGVTVGTVAKALRLPAEQPAWSAVVESIPLDRAGELVEVELPADAVIVGKSLRQVPMPSRARIAAVVRDTRVVVPDGDTVLAADDLLLVIVPDGAGADRALTGWVDGHARGASSRRRRAS